MSLFFALLVYSDYYYIEFIDFELYTGERQCWNITIFDDMIAECDEEFIGVLLYVSTFHDGLTIERDNMIATIIIHDDDGKSNSE